jgi:hypothetical protein
MFPTDAVSIGLLKIKLTVKFFVVPGVVNEESRDDALVPAGEPR